MVEKKNTIFEYLLVLITIFASGNLLIFHYFTDLMENIMFISVLLFNFFYSIKKKIIFFKTDYYFFFIFIVLFCVHFLKFGIDILFASLGFLVLATIAFLNIKTIYNFGKIYILLLYYICLFSLFFYFLYIFFDIKIGFQLNSTSYHNLIYHYKFEGIEYFRNCGPFWEPGAFAGYIILALIFILRDFKLMNKKIISVLIFSLLTTVSTTGYLCLFVVIFIYLIKKKIFYFDKNNFYKPLFIFLILFMISFYFYNELDFLEEKILFQKDAATFQLKNYQSNRLGNFLYDLTFIKKNPFFGISANTDLRILFDPFAQYIILNQGNALSGFTVRFGLIGIITLITIFFMTTFRMSNSLSISILSVLLLCLLLFSEKYFNYPLIFTLFFTKDNFSNKLLKQ